MTDTPNLGLPYIDGSQAQKHVTHNEALRILDAAIQIGVLDLTLTAPPAGPVEGERHVVASGATGAWAGQDDTIATWQDGAWAFLAPKAGWCIWSVADNSLFVFDGAAWHSAGGTAAFDNVAHFGINTTASSPNLLTVTSNAALFTAIDAADGGTGDMRLQVSKETSTDTASVFFSENFSGRAEFGLVGDDAFKLKVSPDGTAWTEVFTIDQDSGNLTLPRGLALTGIIAPAQITADQNDYNPADLATASVLQISTDTARKVSGFASGAEGRCLTVINVGSQPVTLLDESASSSASNRFSLAGNLTIGAKQAAILRYDGTAARWQAIAGGARLTPGNIPGYLSGLTLSTAGSSSSFGIAAGAATDSTNTDMMSLASAYTKTTGTWTAGSGNGALDTGTIASSAWYHVFLIRRPDTGTVDVLLSLSATAPTLPANYTLSRRIGSLCTSSSQWIKFSQFGDEFLWDQTQASVNAATGSTSAQTATLAVPTGIKVNALINVGVSESSGNDGRAYVSSFDKSDEAPAVSNFNVGVSGAAATGLQNWSQLRVRTNASAQIRYRAMASTASIWIGTAGWIDDRGKLQ
jgi:hypothetical protein